MIPDPDPRWLVAFWLVIGVSLVATGWATVVLVSDFLRGAFSDADLDPAAPVRVARPRVDARDRSAASLSVSPLPRVSERKSGLELVSRLDPREPLDF